MKCLTYEESQKWLGAKGVQIDEFRNLLLPKHPDHIMITMPKRANNMVFFSDRLADWLSSDFVRMIWLSDWQTFPCQLIPFTKLRAGCGETRDLIEAPGHLFEQSTEEENALMAGLIFLIMAFNWSAYILAENSNDYVYLGDEYIVISNADTGKMKEALTLATDYNLRVIKDVKEAWK